jgi:hypothetical protein
MTAMACPVKNTAVIAREIPEFVSNSRTQLYHNMLFVDCAEYYARAKHYGEFSWMDDVHRKALKFAKKRHGHWKLKSIIRNPSIFSFLDKHHMTALSKMYSFLVYDLVDYGLIYWIYRRPSRRICTQLRMRRMSWTWRRLRRMRRRTVRRRPRRRLRMRLQLM